MKIKIAALRATAIAAILLILSVRITPAGDPVPGVDVKLGKNPGGQLVAQTKTSDAGKFVLNDVKPGKYLLDISSPPTAKSFVNTSRSNIKHGSIVMKTGVLQEVQVSVEFATGKDTKPHAPVAIEITAEKGKITGVITREVATKPSGAK